MQESTSNEQIEERVRLLLEAKDVYYTSEEPLFSDAEFDRLEDELRSWSPQHSYFSLVGSPSPAAKQSKKRQHSITMLSMDKAKSPEEVSKWLQRIKSSAPGLLGDEPQLCVQPKIDGISASCVYRKGRLEYIASRGDGSSGQDISHIASYMQGIPSSLDLPPEISEESFEVRGELYMPKDTEFPSDGRPLRNICSGLVNRKEKFEDLSFLRFAAYQCPQSRLAQSEYQQIHELKRLGFHSIEAILCDEAALAIYFAQYLAELRQKWDYETDGLIICLDDSRLYQQVDALWVVDHHHHYAIALKPPAEGAPATLLDINWQLGRQGRLTPVAIFSPVKLAGAQIERASLHNYQNVCNLSLHLGDTLYIERAGDVIPYVRSKLEAQASEATSQQTPPIPQCCPSCKGPLEVEGVDLLCRSETCPEQDIQSILFWVQQAEMDQIAEQSIRQLYELGLVRDIASLYQLSAESLSQIQGYAQKKIDNFLEQLEKSRSLTVQQLLLRLGIPMLQAKTILRLKELRSKSRLSSLISLLAQRASDQGKREASLFAQELDGDELVFCLGQVLPELSAEECQSLCSVLLENLRFEENNNLLSANLQSQQRRENAVKAGFQQWEAALSRIRPGFLEIQSIPELLAFEEQKSRYAVLDKLSQWLSSKRNRRLLEQLATCLVLKSPSALEAGAAGQGKLICMTGSGPRPRKALQEELEQRGFRISSSLTKDVELLLCDEPHANSSKLKKAREWNIEIASYESFFPAESLPATEIEHNF